MKTCAQGRRIKLSEFESFSWPVKVRVRAHPHPAAPRLSPTFPASVSFCPQPKAVLRTLGCEESRPCRRWSNWLDWSKTGARVVRSKEAAQLAALIDAATKAS